VFLASLFSLEKLVHFFQVLLLGPGRLEGFFFSAALVAAYMATSVTLPVDFSPTRLFSFI
jgi:hypothetical protein